MATEILHLSFRLMTEKTFSHSMDSSLLISDVKALIETDSEIPPENQRLIFKGQLLKDEYTLQSYGLKSGNTIHVVGRVPQPQGPATSPSVDVPDNVVEPDPATDNTQQNTRGTEQVPGGQTSPGYNPGTGFGFPMGIFMSPIYATISVSGPGNAPTTENAVEQVASQFFSGVVNSLLTSFNNGPGTATNTPSAGPSPSTSRSQDDELLVDLELSTSVLNRVTRSVKRLNSTPNSQRPTTNNVNVTTNPQFNHSSSASVTESMDSFGEFNNLASSTENANLYNFRSEPESSSSTPNVPNVNLNGGNQTESDSESCKYVHASGYEEFEGCGGKVLLIDPEVLSSKLPWESLNKLEQVLFEHSNMDESKVVDDVHEGFVVTEEFVEIDDMDDISSRNPVVDVEVDTEQVHDYLEPLNPEDFEFKFEEVKVEDLEVLNESEEHSGIEDEKLGKDKQREYKKVDLREESGEYNLQEKYTKYDNGTSKFYNGTDGVLITEELDRANEVNGPQVVEVTATEESESLGYEDFMNKFHKYELRLNDLMRDYNLGNRNKQLDRFKQLSSAMAIKTRIDASLCALFSWMQNQMVSTERARAFASHMGWSTSSNNTNNNSTMPSTSEEIPINENQGNVPTNNQNNTTNGGGVSFGSSTGGMPFVPNPTSTTTFTSNIPGVGEVTVQLPVAGSGVSVSGTRFGTNNSGFSQNNPFNVSSTNPFAATQTSTFSPFSSNDSSTINNNNRDNTQRPEVDFQQSTSTESDLNTTNQTDLFARYRANPDFASSMARVRQTKLSDSYYSS